MSFSRVIRTKLIPPPLNPRILPRPRMMEALKHALDYRLTILQAGAGYGKSTALAELAQRVNPCIWYQVNQEDNDPFVFLLHLCHATTQALGDVNNLPTAFLEAWDGVQGPLPWRGVVDGYINALSTHLEMPALFVLDDFQQIHDNSEVIHILDRLVVLGPDKLHVLLSGRPTIDIPSLARLRLQGNLLMLDQSALAFNFSETASLFSTYYGFELTADEVTSLVTYSEGWAIALQLIWQSIRNQSLSPLEFPAHWQAGSLESLFDVLAYEVFEHQPADVREFLLVTAVLRELNPKVCDAMQSETDSAAMLAYLKRQDLFVVETGRNTLRYHHIFHDFLRQQSTPSLRQSWDRRAAGYYLKEDKPESAIYHLIEARAWEDVAGLLDSYASTLLAIGRLDTLSAYIDALPPEILIQHPGLVFTLGELTRLHSRFDEALGWYVQAENIWRSHGQQDGIARALRGQARVFLDTVNPSKAEELLEKAIRLSDGFEDRESQVRLLELLAENKLNSGRVEEAENLRKRADELRREGPSDEQLLVRVWLRTGRLADVKIRLEQHAQAEKKEPVHLPRAHRETMLLLSLVHVFMGQAEQAYLAALEGIRRGSDLKSPFVSAVGHIRLGHALMLRGGVENYTRAREQYEKSIEISRSLAVARLRVESGWGLCRAYGYQGDVLKAQQYAQDAIEIAAQAGDEWMASLVRLTLGASLSMAARYEAAEQWLGRAALGFQECSDPFGQCAARLWLSFGYFKQKQTERLNQTLPGVFLTCRNSGYDFLFSGTSFLGPLDERIFIPLLLHARNEGWERGYIHQLLEQLGLPELVYHPGYRLRVRTLGGFQVWRGAEAIPANGWRREKSRQLFQLLLVFRYVSLDRDQICEFLWPEADPLTAQRNFKIALSTLFQVLEPEHNAGEECAYILRDGSAYSLRPGADFWLDADQFLLAGKRAGRAGVHGLDDLLKAVELYQGAFLPDILYEGWAVEERERLAAQFLEISDRLVELFIKEGRYSEAVELSLRVLNQDNCWERAYRHLMVSYHRLGDHGQVGRAYQRCLQTLRDELGVKPSMETQALFNQLISAQ